MANWLFLRGQWDCRTQKSIDDDDDMWLQLFDALDDNGITWFKSSDSRNGWVGGRNILVSNADSIINGANPTHIFARGGFDYYLPILKAFPNSYKARYGAGCRFMPETEIDYQLILVDTEAQKQDVLDKYPGANVHLLIKPAADHFKPIECEKEYDVCLIANEQQRSFKGIDWVYETAPKDLKILHLGYHETLNPPDNITCKRVDRIDMPKWINKCRVGIVPYGERDSCPRVIPEMLACGLPIVCLDSVNIWHDKYRHITRSNKKVFWEKVGIVNVLEIEPFAESKAEISKHYKENLSIPIAANHIKSLIKGSV